VVALVDETLAAALPTLPLDQPAPIGRHPCNNALGAPSQDVYAVEPDDSDPKVSIRNATVDGYAMALYVNRTDKKAYLGASSPCVRPPSGT
jgi:hypothetical protein